MLPGFAKLLGEEYNLEKNAVEIVNINGIAFEPFARLFNNTDVDKRINVRCSVITDDDRGENPEDEGRAATALNLKNGMVDVFLAKYTFEYELFCANEKLLKKAYSELHPKTDLTFHGDLDERARAFVEKLKANNDKGVFAQFLAGKIEEGGEYKSFVVPDYIKRALKWAIKGSETDTD